MAPQAWLGSAVAIKDPTAAAFLRQNGSNLLLVGHREEAALGVLANCLISLAAQLAPGDGNSRRRVRSFYILDGIRADAPEVGFWNRLESALPHAMKIANPRGSGRHAGRNLGGVDLAAGTIARAWAADLSYHLQSRPFPRPAQRGRFRLLLARRQASRPARPSSSMHILREGPALGIHTLVWCDTYNNVSRFLDRQSLRDFEMRVLFQMNATDSSNLMDTPDASRLGVHVAIFYDEGQGRMEKFRPYGLPSNEWLAWVKKQLPSRAKNHARNK